MFNDLLDKNSDEKKHKYFALLNMTGIIVIPARSDRCEAPCDKNAVFGDIA